MKKLIKRAKNSCIGMWHQMHFLDLQQLDHWLNSCMSHKVAYGDYYRFPLFSIMPWIYRGIIPLHKNLLCSFQNAILTELWLEAMQLHRAAMIRSRCHSCSQASVAAAQKKRSQPLLLSILCTNEMPVFSFFLIETPADALVQGVLAAISLIDSVGGATYFHKRRVYGLPRATYGAMFHCVCCKFQYGNPGNFGSHLQKYTGQRLKICRSSSSKVVVGNGGLNSKMVLCAIWLVLSRRVT